MKTLVTFAITWTTATLLLFWLGDYNMYVDFPDGRVLVKQHAEFRERVFDSVIFAGLYSLINTSLLLGLQKLNEQRCKKALE